jgi:hypothetical protein
VPGIAVVDKEFHVHSTSRRRFLETAALVGAAGVSPSATAAVATSPPMTRGWLLPHVGTAFMIRGPEGDAAEMILARLTPLPQVHGYTSIAQATQWCFSAQFTARPDTPQIRGLAQVCHPALGSFALMTSPVGGDGTTWEAVFNRVKLA